MADDRRRKRNLSPVDDDNKKCKLHSYTLEFKLNAIGEVKNQKRQLLQNLVLLQKEFGNGASKKRS